MNIRPVFKLFSLLWEKDWSYYGEWRLAHPSLSLEELYVTRKLLQILLLTVSSIFTLVQ
jgi:hypothetical protein